MNMPPKPRLMSVSSDDDLRRLREIVDKTQANNHAPGEAEKASLKDRLAPEPARATVVIFASILGVLVALVAVALVVNSIIDFKLTKSTPKSPPVAPVAAAPATASVSASLKPEPPQSEQDKAAARDRLNAAMRQLVVKPPAAPAPASAARHEQSAPAAPSQAPAAPAVLTRAEPPPAAVSADEVSRMLARASSLIREGQIASARSLLEVALRSGDPSVAFALAETYDPKTLERWRAIGIAGDAERARTLYKQAEDGGVADAGARLSDLDR